MEGVRIFDSQLRSLSEQDQVKMIESDLKATLEGMVKNLFGQVKVRWVDAYFPFTLPSYEMEIYFNEQWLEVLGCGVIQQRIMENSLGVLR
jgi:phenylalanyl-tRNA synthetase alpha chain